MPPELLIVPFFSMKNAAGSSSTSVAIDFGSVRVVPERGRLRLPDSWTDEHVELRERVERSASVGRRDAGFWPTIQSIFSVPASASLEDRESPVVLRGVLLRQPRVAKSFSRSPRPRERLERS
jgi:hypothetical protein